jgi:hypothetical protein
VRSRPRPGPNAGKQRITTMTTPRGLLIVLAGLLLMPVTAAVAQEGDDAECMMCHDDRSLIVERDGRRVSMYVNYQAFAQSVHAGEGCLSCHADVDVDDLPHAEDLDPVDCSMCHDDEVEQFTASLHGQAVHSNRFLAPSCTTCHGKHDILSSKNPAARTYVTNIPSLCGDCHKDGTRVSELRAISQRHILEDYAESIHGDGLFRRGLIVTAVCTSCHFAHNILPHENPLSSINEANIASTCQQCHARIEEVHVKVIDGELWEKRPHEVPICVDCHQPHRVRRVDYTASFPDRRCMDCHSNPDLSVTEPDGTVRPLFVDPDDLLHSSHRNQSCISCHTGVTESRDPVCLDSGPVDCAMCHAEQVDQFAMSTHGQKVAAGDERAPYCTTCHGDHRVLAPDNPESPVFPRNLPDLCATCHENRVEPILTNARDGDNILTDYSGSIHGKGLLQSGLLVTATCVDCHTAHMELPISDTLSTVHPSNVATTCARCHDGIMEQFNRSVHSPFANDTDQKLPACNDCHRSHTIRRTDAGDFRQDMLNQCGDCHEEVTETYFDTFHGKVSQLGSEVTAKCSDCHGAHNILPPTDPASKLSRQNVVETCGTCHPNSNRQFVGYLTHATHHDRDKYPWLYYTFWFMTSLLVGVFAFFGIHTLLWLPRAVKERREARRRHRGETGGATAPEAGPASAADRATGSGADDASGPDESLSPSDT